MAGRKSWRKSSRHRYQGQGNAREGRGGRRVGRGLNKSNVLYSILLFRSTHSLANYRVDLARAAISVDRSSLVWVRGQRLGGFQQDLRLPLFIPTICEQTWATSAVQLSKLRFQISPSTAIRWRFGGREWGMARMPHVRSGQDPCRLPPRSRPPRQPQVVYTNNFLNPP